MKALKDLLPGLMLVFVLILAGGSIATAAPAPYPSTPSVSSPSGAVSETAAKPSDDGFSKLRFPVAHCYRHHGRHHGVRHGARHHAHHIRHHRHHRHWVSAAAFAHLKANYKALQTLDAAKDAQIRALKVVDGESAAALTEMTKARDTWQVAAMNNAASASYAKGMNIVLIIGSFILLAMTLFAFFMLHRNMKLLRRVDTTNGRLAEQLDTAQKRVLELEATIGHGMGTTFNADHHGGGDGGSAN